MVNASPEEAASAYHRNRDRPAPHNLYLRPTRLPGGAVGPAAAPLRFGPSPTAGTPAASYGAAGFAVTWSSADRRWLLSMDGTPLVTDTGRARAATVVWQHVDVTTDESIEDVHGTVSPVVHTVGDGRAVVLRDGQRFTGTWSRPTVRSPTTFRTGDGRELPLAAGPVWVLLTPE